MFKFLGGKPEGQESDIECVKREVKEEIDVNVIEGSIKYSSSFENIAYNKKNTKVNIRLYTCNISRIPVP